MRALIVVGVLMLSIPNASAGTPEAPEVVDAKGDCEFAPGNHYADIVGAWISDETATDFNVNIQLAEWIEPIAQGAGFTIQFSHQGVNFGVIGAYFAGQWEYGNGVVSMDAQVQAWNDTTGSFQSSPPVLTILFQKSNFPHRDAADNQLVDFWGGSVDLKPMFPFFMVPAQLPLYPPPFNCDAVVGTKAYAFQVGDHSAHSMGGSATDASQTSDEDTASDNVTTQADPDPALSNGPETRIPGAGALAGLAVFAALALARRRR